MNNNLIITIGREYGTGGREIGQKLALRLGVPFYDRELITRAAKKTGFDEKLFEQLDKRATNSFLYSLFRRAACSVWYCNEELLFGCNRTGCICCYKLCKCG